MKKAKKNKKEKTEPQEKKNAAQMVQDVQDLTALFAQSAEHYTALSNAPFVLPDGTALHPSEIRILMLIDDHREENVTLTLLARETGNSKSAVSKPIRRLCDKELLAKKPMPGNGRENLLNLTAKGQEALDSTRSQLTQRLQAFDAIETQFKPKEIKAIAKFLESILAL